MRAFQHQETCHPNMRYNRRKNGANDTFSEGRGLKYLRKKKEQEMCTISHLPERNSGISGYIYLECPIKMVLIVSGSPVLMVFWDGVDNP